jgi:isoleucyl-tRNA synthetase
MSSDKLAAYHTLYSILIMLSKTLAPFLPYISEGIYKGLTGEKSVHLSDWLITQDLYKNISLSQEMDEVIEICSAVSALRKKHEIRLRQPLSNLTIFSAHHIASSSTFRWKKYTEILMQELNIKKIIFTENLKGIGAKKVVINYKKLGTIIGKDFQKIIQAIQAENYHLNADESLSIENYTITPENYEMKYIPEVDLVASTLHSFNSIVVLDISISPELLEEGLFRDWIRAIQNARKEKEFNVSDQIQVQFTSSENLTLLVLKYQK